MATSRTRAAPDSGLPLVEDIGASPEQNAVSLRDTETDDEIEQQNVVERLRGILAANPADQVTVRLYKQNGKTGKFDYCRKYHAHEFESDDLDAVRAEWGSGEFEFRIINSKGIASRIRQSIAPTFAAPVTHQQPAQNPVDNGNAELLRMLVEGQQTLTAAISHRPDPMAQMQQMLTLAAAMKNAFAPAQSAPASDPMSMVTQVFSMVREAKSAVKELTDEDRPAADPADPMSMLPGIIDLVKTSMSGNQQPQGMQPMQPITLPQSIAQPLQTVHQNPMPEQPTEPEPETMETLIVKGLIEDLLQIAIDGKPASEGGAFIFEKLPDESVQMMENRYWFEIIAMKFPTIKPHEKWLREAKAEADKLFAAADAENPDGDDPT